MVRPGRLAELEVRGGIFDAILAPQPDQRFALFASFQSALALPVDDRGESAGVDRHAAHGKKPITGAADDGHVVDHSPALIERHTADSLKPSRLCHTMQLLSKIDNPAAGMKPPIFAPDECILLVEDAARETWGVDPQVLRSRARTQPLPFYRAMCIMALHDELEMHQSAACRSFAQIPSIFPAYRRSLVKRLEVSDWHRDQAAEFIAALDRKIQTHRKRLETLSAPPATTSVA